MSLEPEAVFDERVDWHRVTRFVPGFVEEPVEAVIPGGIGQVRCPPMRAQEHAFRHVTAPELQRLPEDGDLESTPDEMGRRREPVWARADDDRITRRGGHGLSRHLRLLHEAHETASRERSALSPASCPAWNA